MKAAIITSSDSGYAGEREDKSGSVIQEILEANDYEVVHTILLPDDRKMLADEMARIADEGIAELIVTTGGTGFSPRDCMPEATKDIICQVFSVIVGNCLFTVCIEYPFKSPSTVLKRFCAVISTDNI